jgi:putative ABC transport system permease protein
LHKGDYNKELVVATLIRDASMNAALTSSKRFLISQADMNEISVHMGGWEYCFEFLLNEEASTAVLQKDYMEAGMPSNGVAVTGKLLMLLNNLSHGLIAFILIAISVLLIIIAVLCLSYIIRATMAEENHTLAEMKAIGFPIKAIEQLYQIKYILLVLIATLVGFWVAIGFGEFFSSSIIMYCGYGAKAWMKWVFALVGVVLLGLMVLYKCHKILRRSLKSTVVQLMKEQELSEFRLNQMGFVFQNAQMLKNLCIFDNIILPGLVAKKETPEDIRKCATQLMNRMQIEETCQRDIREVSGGQIAASKEFGSGVDREK